jgi:hypothetical protein
LACVPPNDVDFAVSKSFLAVPISLSNPDFLFS